MTVILSFRSGAVELAGLPSEQTLVPGFVWDERRAAHTAPARLYHVALRALVRGAIPHEDRARAYAELDTSSFRTHELRDYQHAALEAWRAARHRGVIVLPTGAGKTVVALSAIADRRRSALVVAPTLDLVRQWHARLTESFGGEVGMVGGGSHDVRPLTVATYDSAHLHMEHLGARFGTVVFDECHHLPSGAYRDAASLCLAPFRLGLTATPERTDGRDQELDTLIGPVVHRAEIGELSGRFLASYETIPIAVELSDEERADYDAARETYRGFCFANGLRMPVDFSRFVMLTARGERGRAAMTAYRRQRAIAFAAPSKLDEVGVLLGRHRTDRSIVFTEDNDTAAAIASRYLLPIMTHRTKLRERATILRLFADGSYRAVVTSKVLNEGVDVPEANVAIVVSGSGSVMQHVQRLGRILRMRDGKRATLYELVTRGTAETWVSERRRAHDAYR